MSIRARATVCKGNDMTALPEQHVDIAALQDLKEIMESEFETLINTFIMDSLNKLKELDEAIGTSDPEALRKVAHSLKGSSSNICAGELSELARQLEFLGREGSTDGATALLENLREEFEVVKEVLQNNL